MQRRQARTHLGTSFYRHRHLATIPTMKEGTNTYKLPPHVAQGQYQYRAVLARAGVGTTPTLV